MCDISDLLHDKKIPLPVAPALLRRTADFIEEFNTTHDIKLQNVKGFEHKEEAIAFVMKERGADRETAEALFNQAQEEGISDRY
jgi:hypothetical protein